MQVRKAPRYQGKITTWKDDQGFGFITPNGGGPAVFVHIKSVTGRASRPTCNDAVTYDLSANNKGQPRAENVILLRERDVIEARAARGSLTIPFALGFLVFVALACLAGRLPWISLGMYLALSILTYARYARDKAASKQSQRRTPEDTLHFLALLGGWPGALMAQHLVRHKSKKQSFQIIFWITVVINCGVLAWLMIARPW